MKNEKTVFAAKCVFVAALVFGLIFYSARNSGSKLGVLAVFVSVVGFIAIAGVVLYLYISITMWINQWVLNHGGIDTAWLWFKSDPKGLENLRLKANQASATPAAHGDESS
jgi:hypothetical protein